MTVLSKVEMAIGDPILGINEAFNADPRANKVNLGVGVYCNENGQIPVLRTVQKAERAFLETSAPHNYLPIDGLPAYNHAVQELLFGADATAVKEDRVVPSATRDLSLLDRCHKRFTPVKQPSDSPWLLPQDSYFHSISSEKLNLHLLGRDSTIPLLLSVPVLCCVHLFLSRSELRRGHSSEGLRANHAFRNRPVRKECPLTCLLKALYSSP